MKSLISVTPREYKRDFNEVMEMCTDMCMTTNQEIIITVPTSRKSNTHAEIAKFIPVEGAIMADAFEKEGVYSLISPEVEHRLARAVETAAKELVKMM